MREVELKGVADDPRAIKQRLTNVGGRRVLTAALTDRRYDTSDYALRARDEVLRVRITANAETQGVTAVVDIKGAASYPAGYKVREEHSTAVADVAVIERILTTLGLRVTREIERQIEMWQVGNATVRFEEYPRMDVLIEVEGEPEAIDGAIALMALERAAFTTERLSAFVQRYETRTGKKAALCARELAGDFRYRLDDA